MSHSLPLPHPNFSLPLTSNYIEYDHPKNDRPLPRTANIEYLVTKAPKIELDGHSTDTNSDKVLQSEDELSSGNVSPRMRRSSKNRGVSSNNGSRNHSPRPVNGETRLRAG